MSAPALVRPLLHLRSAPATEPGHLDDRVVEQMYAEARRAERRRAHYVQPVIPLDGPGSGADLDFGAQPTRRGRLPDPACWVQRLVPAVLECMAGLRPPGQLMHWVALPTHQRIARRSAAARRRGIPGIRRPRILKVHVCEPADGIAEASVVVDYSGRVRAAAARLEGIDGRWVLTAFTLG